MKKPILCDHHNLITGKIVYKVHFFLLGLAFQIPVYFKRMKKEKGILFK